MTVSGKTLLHRCSYQCIADGRGQREVFREAGLQDFFGAWLERGILVFLQGGFREVRCLEVVF